MNPDLSKQPHLWTRKRLYWGAVLAVSLFLTCSPLFWGMVFGDLRSDNRVHIEITQKAWDHGGGPSHFLYHGILLVFAGFRTDYDVLGRAAVLVLSCCVVAKGLLSYSFLCYCDGFDDKAVPVQRRPSTFSPAILAVLAFALLFCSPIIRPWQLERIYLGQITPNVWHNPTSLLVWPIALIAFFSGYRFLESGRVKWLAVLAPTLAFSVLAKPNFAIAFGPVFFAFALYEFRLSRRFWLSQAAMMPTVAVLLWQYVRAFGSGGMSLAPFQAWELKSNSITLSVLFSLAFPAAYLVSFRRRWKLPQLLAFSWVTFLSALAWKVLFVQVNEGGELNRSGNFSWGSYITLYIVFLATTADLLLNSDRRGENRYSLGNSRHLIYLILAWSLLGLHLLSGVVWFLRQLMGFGYA